MDTSVMCGEKSVPIAERRFNTTIQTKTSLEPTRRRPRLPGPLDLASTFWRARHRAQICRGTLLLRDPAFAAPPDRGQHPQHRHDNRKME